MISNRAFFSEKKRIVGVRSLFLIITYNRRAKNGPSCRSEDMKMLHISAEQHSALRRSS